MQIGFENLLAAAAAKVGEMQYQLDTRLFLPYVVDEIAVVFRTKARLEAFRTFAVANGMENFNSQTDHMDRLDERQGFDVKFEFLRFPGAPWRIEAMEYTGKAPLHMEQLNRRGDGCVIHASFKLPDAQAWERARWALLASDAGAHRATYSNGYGVFSYYGPWMGVYLKPRLNTRDVVVAPA